jgi:hypothetical protein
VRWFKQFLAKNSKAYNYLGLVIPQYTPLLAQALMKVGLIAHQPIGDNQRMQYFHHMVFTQEYGPEMQKAWEVTRKLISRLNEEASTLGISFAVVSIPFREQVYDSHWEYLLNMAGMRALELTRNKPDQLLSHYLGSAQIPFLQLLPRFRKAAKDLELYQDRDNHLSAQGHHLAAHLIYDWLVEEKLVPLEDHEKGNSKLKADS